VEKGEGAGGEIESFGEGKNGVRGAARRFLCKITNDGLLLTIGRKERGKRIRLRWRSKKGRGRELTLKRTGFEETPA